MADKNTSPIVVLLPAINECLVRAAPERANELLKLVSERTMHFSLSQDPTLTFSALPKTAKVTAPIHAMEVLWCTCYFGYVMNQEMSADTKAGIFQFDIRANQRRASAAALFDWAYERARNPLVNSDWPEKLPRPLAKPGYASDEHVANELFLISLAWILLHEIGHLALHHIEASPTSLQDETEADKFATDWLFDECPDLRHRQKRALGPILACMWMYLYESHNRQITTHPHVEERLHRILMAARLHGDDAAIVTCFCVLQFFAEDANVHPKLDGETFLDNIELLLIKLRRR